MLKGVETGRGGGAGPSRLPYSAPRTPRAGVVRGGRRARQASSFLAGSLAVGGFDPAAETDADLRRHRHHVRWLSQAVEGHVAQCPVVLDLQDLDGPSAG